MAFQFPASPAVNQTFTPVSGTTYRWSGTAWHLLAGPGSFITQADADTRYVNVDEAQNTTNRIINGKMAIDQRNAGALVAIASGAGRYTLDRWSFSFSLVGAAVTVQQSSALGDFNLAITVTAGGTMAAGELALLQQTIEGTNIADLHYGFADAAPMTLAFDVLATATGAFSVAVLNNIANKSYVAPYTINAASTWETKVIVIPGDPAAATTTNNGSGMTFSFSLGTGTTFNTSTVNAWLAGTFINKTGDINFMATAGRVFRIRNVRLYKGSVDFGPDRRLYAEELALCQRYYEKSYAQDTVPGTLSSVGCMQFMQVGAFSTPVWAPSVVFRVVKRAASTVTIYNPAVANSQIRCASSGTDFTGTSVASASESSFVVTGTTPVATATTSLAFYHFTASAEL